MNKILSVFGLIMFLLISVTSLYACGGGNGGDNDDFLAAMLGNKKALAGLKGSGFEPFSQESYIPKEILDIPIHTYEEEQRLKKIKRDMDYWGYIAKNQILLGKIMTSKIIIGNIVKFGAGLALGMITGGTAGIAAGAGYSGATSAVEDTMAHKEGRIMTDSIKAAAKSGLIGKFIPNAKVGAFVDEATNHLSFSPKKTPVRAGCGGACTISQGYW